MDYPDICDLLRRKEISCVDVTGGLSVLTCTPGAEFC